MKLLLTLTLVVGAAFFSASPVKAQRAGNYPITLITTNAVSTRLTNAAYAFTTNTYSTITTNEAAIGCSEYDYVGLTISAAMTAASTNGTTQWQVFRSGDNGAHYETTADPANTITITMNGTNPVTKFALIDTRRATHLRLGQLVNTNSMGVTNFSNSWEFTIPKVATVPSTSK